MLWASERWPIGKFEVSTLWGALHIWRTIELQSSVLPNHCTLIYIVIIPPLQWIASLHPGYSLSLGNWLCWHIWLISDIRRPQLQNGKEIYVFAVLWDVYPIVSLNCFMPVTLFPLHRPDSRRSIHEHPV